MVKCADCGFETHYLPDHLLEVHGLSQQEYEAKHPDAMSMSKAFEKGFRTSLGKFDRVSAPPPSELTIKFGGVRFPVNWDVPESACLPLPPYYMTPCHGQLATDIHHAAVAVRKGRHILVWGLPGSGKDAFFSALSNVTRMPAGLFGIKPGADIQSWFYSRSFDKDGTSWEEGRLLKMLRDGYTTKTGRKIPYLIVISDLDRADRSQVEYLRLVLDSIQGRVEGPEGEVYPTFPGTIIACTANSVGAGDIRGRCISANPIDASIMDRIERKFEFAMMDWKDEEPIVRAKFPLLVEQCPGIFGPVGASTDVLRAAVADGSIFAEFSHRAVCAWLGHAEDIIDVTGSIPKNLLKKAAKCILDGLPDEITKDKVKKLIDPHLKGGMLHEGDTTHIQRGKASLADGW